MQTTLPSWPSLSTTSKSWSRLLGFRLRHTPMMTMILLLILTGFGIFPRKALSAGSSPSPWTASYMADDRR